MVHSTSDFRRGLKVEYKGDPYEIIEFQHVKMGRGGANVKTKMKNLRTGGIVEETIRSGEKFPAPELEERKMQFLYSQEGHYYFMDQETFEQIPLSEEQLGDLKLFLKENTEVKILNYKGAPLNVELPTFIELRVAKTEPGFKGDTASGGGKPATLETGAVVRVPFHINEGDIIKVDTRTSEYIERVK
ncbi:MAG: elongation factor P [Thermodesulfovibrionales bacterium]